MRDEASVGRLWTMGAVLALGLGATSCGGDEGGLDEGLEDAQEDGVADAGEPVAFRTTTWEDFPIILEGASPGQIATYTYGVGGAQVGLEDLVDVVSYARVFRPCDLGAQPDADLDSFHYDLATDYVDEAQLKGMHVMVPLPYLGSTSGLCDGQIDGTELWNHDHTVQIPLNKNEITSTFTSYWGGKVGTFIDELDTYDTNDVVWAWRGLEELRYWQPPEVELARTMRAEVDAHDGTRLLMAYTPNHYMPNSSVLNTLLDRPHASLSPHNPASNVVSPANPVARSAVAGVVGAFYPQQVEVNLEVTGALRPLFEHIMTGAYTGLVLGADGHENRIHPYHRSRLGAETRTNLEAIYAAHGESAPDTLVFHAPDMSAAGVLEMSGEEAQHDFWAGLHVADGIYLYNFAYRDDEPAVWDAYARGLHLIKSRMRGAFAMDNRWTPATSNDGMVQTAPGDYFASLPAYADRPDLASPVAPDDEHDVLNATMLGSGGQTFLIVTHSWDQRVNFEVTLPACTIGGAVVYGTSNSMSIVGNTLSDSFSGIDARVYQLRVLPC